MKTIAFKFYAEKRRRRVRQVSAQTNTPQIENTTVATQSNSNSTVETTEIAENATATESSIGTNSTSTAATVDRATNDSVADESNRPAGTETNVAESSSVGSYFVENRNLPGVWFRDVRLDSLADTYFPSPISSSTMPPPILRGRTPPTSPSPRQYEYHTEYNNPAHQAGYYQSQEQSRNVYYHVWNRTAPQLDYRANSGAGKTIIALPPVQLHHGALTNRKNRYKTYKGTGNIVQPHRFFQSHQHLRADGENAAR